MLVVVPAAAARNLALPVIDPELIPIGKSNGLAPRQVRAVEISYSKPNRDVR